MTSPHRILVTGARGFIGRLALVPLQRLGFEVHAVSREPANIHAGHAGDSPGVVWHEVDLLESRESRALVESIRPTHLLHFAWYAEHGLFWNSPCNLDWLSATASLLKAFAESGGKRFVGAGSCAEYMWDGRDFYAEDAPLRPSTLYGAAKASAFLTGEAYAKTASLAFSWGRIFHLFGAGEFPNRIVPALIRAHLRGESLDCSQGTQLRDFLPASAVAEAFARLCASEVQGAVNMGSGQATTLRELSEKISLLTGRTGDIRFGAFQDSGPQRLLPRIDRLTREVGWHPPESIDAGLAEAIDKWKSQM